MIHEKRPPYHSEIRYDPSTVCSGMHMQGNRFCGASRNRLVRTLNVGEELTLPTYRQRVYPLPTLIISMCFRAALNFAPLVIAEPHEPTSKMGYGTMSRDPLGQDKDFPPRISYEQPCCHVCCPLAQQINLLTRYRNTNIHVIQVINNRR